MDAADKEWCVDRVKEAAEKIREVIEFVEADLLEDATADFRIVVFGRLSQAAYSAEHAAKAVEAL